MYSLNQVNKLVSCGRDPARSLPLWRGFLLIPLILVCFAFAPQTQAGTATPDISPAPGGCSPLFNTAEGCNALLLNSTGAGNTGLGWFSLATTVTQSFNTGVGAGTLALNSADSNTAVGAAALILNGQGTRNTAVGAAAMANNTDGADNVAIGYMAETNLVAGSHNIYVGEQSPIADESGTTRIGDPTFVTSCFIAGIAGIPVNGGNPVVVNSSGQLGVPSAGSPLSANELLKERQIVQQMKATIDNQAVKIALQEEEIKALTKPLATGSANPESERTA